jgi:7-cyano-7-deazaguanine synthase in queuosine biosynthesis
LSKSNLLSGSGRSRRLWKSNSSSCFDFILEREFIFLSVAASGAKFLGIQNIYFGYALNNINDTSFFNHKVSTVNKIDKAMNSIFDWNVNLHIPFLNMDKTEIIQTAITCKKLDWLAFTHSCFENRRFPCGKCKGCIERERGFEKLGIEDPLYSKLADLAVIY